MKQLATLIFIFCFNSGFSQMFLELENAVSSKTFASAIHAHKKGQYNEATSLYKDAIRDVELTSPDFLKMLYNYIILNIETQKYGEADRLLGLVKKIRRDTMNNYTQALFRSAEASLYTKTERIDKVEEYRLNALANFQISVGNKHHRYISELNELIVFYSYIGSFEKIEPLLLYSLPITDSIYEKEQKFRLFLFATCYYAFMKNFKSVEEYLSRCITLFDRSSHALYMMNVEDGNKINYMSTIDNSTLNILQEVEKFKLIQKFIILIPQTINEEETWSGTDLLCNITYNHNILWKGLLLRSIQQMQQAVVKSKTDSLITNWKELKKSKKEVLEKEIQRDEEENLLEKLIQKNERDMSIWLERYREYSHIKWTDVQKALQKHDVAIEFVCHVGLGKNVNNEYIQGIFYKAYILRPNNIPTIVVLGEELDVIEALKKSPHDAKYLYPLIWKPLKKYLKGVQNIYLAPTSMLHNVSFVGMKTDNGYLSDHFTIHNMLSTKDLISLKDKSAMVRQANNSLLMGGADFNLPNEELASLDVGKEQRQNLTRGELDELDPTRGQGFDYLPGAKKEVEQINQLLTQCSTALFTDKYATESQFKASIAWQSPDLIHISTHGFYFPEANPNSENKYRTAEKPLLRSGLAFAGANSVWSGKQVSDVTDDGILTAYEISNLDLTNTKLVVLSACETGLGHIRGSEGVYGLQRAFRLAGAQSLIVSLWKVSDLETVAFMTEFYTQWTKKMSVKDAFTKAQNKMKMQYIDQPEKWAGFVLVE